MANSPQARKRARQADTHHKRNVAARSRFRSAIKKVVHAVQAGEKAAAEAAYKEVTPIIDSTCNKGLIHRNKAARHKRRLNDHIRAMV